MTARKSTKNVTAAPTPAPMLVIGVQRETVAAAREVLLDILRVTEAGDAAKIAACKTLKSLCSVTGTSVSNCCFTS